MYSRRRINTIRKMKCVLFGGCDTSFIKDDFEPTKPSFFIEWDKDAGQFKMVPEMKKCKREKCDGDVIRATEKFGSCVRCLTIYRFDSDEDYYPVE